MSCYKHWDALRDIPLGPSKIPKCYPRNPLHLESARWTHFVLYLPMQVQRENEKESKKEKEKRELKNLVILST